MIKVRVKTVGFSCTYGRCYYVSGNNGAQNPGEGGERVGDTHEDAGVLWGYIQVVHTANIQF